MAAVVPEQVVHPRPCLAVHVRVGPAEEIRLDDHVMQVERALLDASPDLAMRAREAPRVRDHADLAGLLRGSEHVLRVGQIEAHRDLDLDVLALRQRQDRLIVVLVARRRQDDRVDAGPVDARLEVRRMRTESSTSPRTPSRCRPCAPRSTRPRRRRSSPGPSRGPRPWPRCPPDRSSSRSLDAGSATGSATCTELYSRQPPDQFNLLQLQYSRIGLSTSSLRCSSGVVAMCGT